MTDKEKIRAYIIARMDDEQEAVEEFDRLGAKESAGVQRSLLGNNAAIVSFIDSMQEEPTSKFDSCIQPGDDIRYNEELGCRVNLSQLQRVAKKDPKYCIYSKDSYTDEERKSLCDGCEEDCEYNQKKEPDELTHSVTKISDQEEPVSEDLEDEIKRYCNKNGYTCTDDGVVYTLNEQIVNTARHFSEWQKQQMMKDAVDAKVTARWPLHSSPLYNSYEMYVPYAQHLSEGDKVKLIIIKED